MQQRIAGILSAYDELIENSQRRIRILEAMARALYREWFVHFRFPGHENHPRVASPLGEIPQGWEVKTLRRSLRTSTAAAPIRRQPTSDYEPIGSPSSGQTRGSSRDIRIRDAQRARIRQNGDMLVDRISDVLDHGTTGYVQFTACDAVAIGSTEFIVLTLELAADVRLSARLQRRRFRRVASRACQLRPVRQRVQRATSSDFQIARPAASSLLERFERSSRRCSSRFTTLQRQIQNLRRTRDLLLPRLLSGQIEVEAA